MQEIIRRRLKALWDNTGFALVDDPLRVGYYSEVADAGYGRRDSMGEEFVSYLKKTYSPLDVVFRLERTKPHWYCLTEEVSAGPGMERTCITG